MGKIFLKDIIPVPDSYKENDDLSKVANFKSILGYQERLKHTCCDQAQCNGADQGNQSGPEKETDVGDPY